MELSAETILLVDDNETVLETTAKQLRALGATVHSATTLAEGGERARQIDFDVALLDLQLPDGLGLDLLAQLRAATPDLPVIMLTAYGNVRTAVEAMRLGAVDYLEKPFTPDDLELALERALTVDALRREIRTLRRNATQGRGAIVMGEGGAMQAIWHLVETVAPTEASVLITGESGTGKEVIARAIHQASARSSGPFIPVNCGGIPETLVEDQLFGHEAHAFTDARSLRRGDFELANKGTIFLDEIGEMPLASQPTLLRILDQRRFYRIGGEREVRADVRVIAATNRSLEAAVSQARFRQDLLFRLNVFTIEVPPLRERREELPLLVAAFLRDLGAALGKPKRRMAPETLQVLCAFAWPGNIRQLRNAIEHALIVCPDATILPHHLPEEIGSVGKTHQAETERSWEDWFDRAPFDNLPLATIEQQVERVVIQRALRRAGGQRGAAAQLLGLSTDLLRYRLQKHGLLRPEGHGPMAEVGT